MGGLGGGGDGNDDYDDDDDGGGYDYWDGDDVDDELKVAGWNCLFMRVTAAF
jgi:hypothetical protein